MHLGLIKEIWRASLGVEAQMVKNLPAMQETRVQSLGHEDPLEEDMSTHSSILAWRIPWTEEPRGLQSMKVMQVFFTQSCLTLCNPVDCSPPVFSVCGILQARILEWVATSFSR